MDIYYTYAYLRKDGRPYYIGKGCRKRAYQKHRFVYPPKDKSRILFLKKNLSEAEAFKHECYMIKIFGRKCDGGILYNLTVGGEGTSGWSHTEETKQKISASNSRPHFKRRGIMPTNIEQFQKLGALATCKPIKLECITTGEVIEFNSRTEASNHIKASLTCIGRLVTGKQKQTKGWQIVS